jgi:hypothetical protein
LQRLADALIDDVRAAMAELETLCAPLATILDRRDWKGCEKLLSDMARARHALQNAWDASKDVRTDEFDDEIRARVKKVIDYRAWHVQRLQKRHAQTGERLQMIARWKAYARSVAGKQRARPVLFSDIR